MNEMAYVLQAWLPLLVWQQVEAPRYHKGYITISFLSGALIITTFTIRVLHARQTAKLNRPEGAEYGGISIEGQEVITPKDNVDRRTTVKD
jgi:ACS family pantothenate transporter-like MFS transporter